MNKSKLDKLGRNKVIKMMRRAMMRIGMKITMIMTIIRLIMEMKTNKTNKISQPLIKNKIKKPLNKNNQKLNLNNLQLSIPLISPKN